MTLYYKSCESQPQTLLKKYYFDGPCAISNIGLFDPLYVTNHQYKLCIREIKIIKYVSTNDGIISKIGLKSLPLNKKMLIPLPIKKCM